MRGLYAIVDLVTLDAAGIAPVAFAEAVIDGGARVLQVRAKDVDGARALEVLRAVGAVARARQVPIFANDRVDLALLAGSDGLHVGQTDLAPVAVRALAARAGHPLLVGLSTHDAAQVEASLEAPIDYVVIGPVTATPSKLRHDAPIGLDGVRALAVRAREARPERPVFVIGGVDVERARALADVVDGVAVIGALVPRSGDLRDVRSRAREFAAIFEAP